MKQIQAVVDARLLHKASRLFTGTLAGRVIEVLQNARRAQATQVKITNHDGKVTVRDNGKGISDFAKLLALGGSGWSASCEASEDPAGAGLFCLAPREVMVCSRGKKVTITPKAWTGIPVGVESCGASKEGTSLTFADELWTYEVVKSHAVFSGMDVVVDGKACETQSFCGSDVTDVSALGVRVAVMEREQLIERWGSDTYGAIEWKYGHNVAVNFYGQVVTFTYEPVIARGLKYMVEMTGAATGIRLLLPARTQLVENTTYQALLLVLERAMFAYLCKQGKHTLSHKDYQRGIALGFALPEAEPQYTVGLIETLDGPAPVEVSLPKDWPLSRCYLWDATMYDRQSELVNAHVLGALGTGEKRFVPVMIDEAYQGYRWAQLPTITRVAIKSGKQRHVDDVGCRTLRCVTWIEIIAHTSDGKTFQSRVPVGMQDDTKNEETDDVLVTANVLYKITEEDLWQLLGVYDEDGDYYDTQYAEICELFDEFFATLHGPNEPLRVRLVACLQYHKDWERVVIKPSGVVHLHEHDKVLVLRPPRSDRQDGAIDRGATGTSPL